MRSAEKSPPTVQSLSRGLDLLEAIADSDELGLVEIATQTGLRPSTAHRLLATLIGCGYVLQNPRTGRYLLSFKVLGLAARAHDRTSRLRAVARPHLQELSEILGETVNLVALEGARTVYLDQVESALAARLFTQVGRRLPAHCTAAGKAILAFGPRAHVDALVAEAPFAALSPRTITTGGALLAELDRVRASGYAVDAEEVEEGIVCVGAALIDHDGTACAAFSVSGPAPRIVRRGLDELGRMVAAHAQEASRALGHERHAATA